MRMLTAAFDTCFLELLFSHHRWNCPRLVYWIAWKSHHGVLSRSVMGCLAEDVDVVLDQSEFEYILQLSDCIDTAVIVTTKRNTT